MRSISVAVAGCGPAGLATALFLTRAGHEAILVERFEAPKPLGSGLILQPTGLAVLRELGLYEPILKRGARILRLFGQAAPSGRTVLDVRYDRLGPHAFGLAVHRASLFDVLYDAVRAAGIPIRTSFEVADVCHLADQRRLLVSTTKDELGPVDLVVDALGTRSPLPGAAFGLGSVAPLAYGALWATLPLPDLSAITPDALEQRYERADTMAGILPIGRRGATGPDEVAFFWSLKPSLYNGWLRAGLASWKDRLQALWPETAPLLATVTTPEQMVLARYAHRTLPVQAAAGIAFVGDCAHSASPQLGQGANMALLDAFALSMAVDGADSIDDALQRYVRLRSRHVRLYQAMSWLFTPFYQSDSSLLPFIRDRLVAPLSRISAADRLLSVLVSGTLAEPVRGFGRYTAAERTDS